MANTSVSKLFIAGIIPEILLAIALITINVIVAKKRNYPVGNRFSLRRLLSTFKKAMLPLLIPIIECNTVLCRLFMRSATAISLLTPLLMPMLINKELILSTLVS